MEQRNGSAILGSGVYLPERIISSRELERSLKFAEGFIEQKTGVRERRFCSPTENVATMAARAACSAMSDAGLTELQHMVIARDLYITEHGPSIALPVMNVLAKSGIDVTDCAAEDFCNYCLGAANAINHASMLVETGRAESVLVLASADYSSIVHENWDDAFQTSGRPPEEALWYSLRSTQYTQAARYNMCLWGCGAGAIVVGRSQEQKIGTLRSRLSRTTQADSFGFSVLPDGRTIASIDGRAIAAFALAETPEFVGNFLNERARSFTDFAAIIPHQANVLLLRKLFETMNVPIEKVIITCDTLGNLGCASIPVAYHLAREQGRIQTGDRVLFLPFGDTQLTLGALEVLI